MAMRWPPPISVAHNQHIVGSVGCLCVCSHWRQWDWRWWTETRNGVMKSASELRNSTTRSRATLNANWPRRWNSPPRTKKPTSALSSSDLNNMYHQFLWSFLNSWRFGTYCCGIRIPVGMCNGNSCLCKIFCFPLFVFHGHHIPTLVALLTAFCLSVCLCLCVCLSVSVCLPTCCVCVFITFITQRRSIAKNVGCFQRRLFVCLCVCLSTR